MVQPADAPRYTECYIRADVRVAHISPDSLDAIDYKHFACRHSERLT